MATSSLSSLKQRKKILTYGKKPSPATRSDAYDLFEADELSADTPIKRRRISPPDPVMISAINVNTEHSRFQESRAQVDPKHHDTFDVPSDDDNAVEISLPSFSSRKPRASSKLVDDRPVQQRAVKLNERTDDAESPSSMASQRTASHASPASAASSTLSALERLKLRKRSSRTNAASSAGDVSADSSASSSPAPYETASTSIRESWAGTHTSTPRSASNPGKLRRAKKQMPDSSTLSALPHSTPEPEQHAVQVSTPRSSSQDNSTAISLTPKQSKLWDGLLDFVDEPEHDAVQDNVRGGREKANQRIARPGKHVRLADKLGINVSDTGVSNEISRGRRSNIDVMDLDFPLPASSNRELLVTGHAHDEQVTRKGERNSRRTYTQQRSYLGANEFDDGLHRNKSATVADAINLRGNSKLSENFDFDVSDSEDKSGKVQSIHELRAAGRLSREAATIDSLLTDAQNHATTARVQRKLAIVRLGARILDVSQAKQFIHDGHDQIIATEIAQTTDKMTGALLMSMMLLLLRVDLPPTTLGQLRLGISRMLALLDEVKELRHISTDDSAPLTDIYNKDIATYLHRLSDVESIWLEDTPEVLNMRVISKQLMHVLFHKLRQQGDRSELLSTAGLKSAAMGLASMSGTDCMLIDQMLSVSILESASLGVSTIWPTGVVENVAALVRNQSTSMDFFPELRFLSYRLTINMTNGTDVDPSIFVKQGAVSVLLHVISNSFEKQTVKLQKLDVKEMDLLVLAIGIMSNLTEYSSTVRQSALNNETKPFLLRSIIAFRSRHETAREVDSEDGTTSNVAYGYLAVMLANLVQEADVKSFISAQLEGNNLKSLVEALEEFLAHHRRLDEMHSNGAEGKELWSSETARLEDMLQKLRAKSL